MRILKIKKFVAKHRKLAIFAMAIILVALLYISWRFFAPYFTEVQLSTEYIGFIGTLLGAIVGGTFTLLGTIWIQQRQNRIQSDFRRSNTIYKPLYEELVHLHKRTMKSFPWHVYSKRPKDNQYAVCYEVWDQIKSDSRYLEVPAVLRRQVEKLFGCIKAYNDEYKKLQDELDEIVAGTSKHYTDIPETHIKKGRWIIQKVLKHEAIKTEEALLVPSINGIDYDEKIVAVCDKYTQELNAACKTLKQIDVVHRKKDEWNKAEEETIDLLEDMIQYSMIRNEG